MKILSENTIEMSADGDPSVLNLNMKVMKPADNGPMVYMVKYGLAGTAHDATASALQIVHNHELNAPAAG